MFATSHLMVCCDPPGQDVVHRMTLHLEMSIEAMTITAARADMAHFPHVECPEEFIDVLLDFLDTTEPAEVDMPALRELLLSHAEG